MFLNEKIKAAEVYLTGINGEVLGNVSTKEALRMAKEFIQLAERLLKELAHCGKQNKGTHVSGKQVEVVLYPKY